MRGELAKGSGGRQRLFGGPATAHEIPVLPAAPAIPGVTNLLVDLSDEDWNWAVSNLRGRALRSTYQYVWLSPFPAAGRNLVQTISISLLKGRAMRRNITPKG